MVRLLTMTAVVGLLMAPAAFAQSSANPAPATIPTQMLSQQGMNFIKEAAAGGLAGRLAASRSNFVASILCQYAPLEIDVLPLDATVTAKQSPSSEPQFMPVRLVFNADICRRTVCKAT
jgi:hypothetical protein